MSVRRNIVRYGIAAAAFLLVCGGALALDFKPYGRGDYETLVKAHAGRPLIIHFWSVTCPACVAELPQWEKLIGGHKDVDILFIDTDDEEERDRAAMRMEKAGLATASHYAFADSFAEKLYFEVDRNWRGELPFTALVTPDGVRTTVTGGLDDPQMAAWLSKNAGKK